MYHVQPYIWVITFLWFGMLLAIDLYIAHRRKGVIKLKAALIQSAFWISIGLGFGLFIWWLLGSTAAGEYYAGYLIEESLSIDNIFVWSIILSYLAIPRHLHHRVLFWGIIGAVVFRTLFVIAGVLLIQEFDFVLLFLGAILLVTAYHIFNSDVGGFDPRKSKIMHFVEHHLPFTRELDGHKFFVKRNGRKVATLLFFAIVVVELTDVLFAIDSVPSVLAVVRDPYVAITSNVAAILGLRALYFVFDNLKASFWLLHKGLGIILALIGVGLLLEPDQVLGIEWFGLHVPVATKLSLILIILAASIIGSLKLKPPVIKPTV